MIKILQQVFVCLVVTAFVTIRKSEDAWGFRLWQLVKIQRGRQKIRAKPWDEGEEREKSVL